MDVYLNGEMSKPDDAKLHFDDAGIQHAVGLFETMSAYNGKVFRLDAHLARIARSAVELGLSADLDLALLREAVETTITYNNITRARLRLTVTAGRTSLLRPADELPQPTVMVVATEPVEYDPAYFDKGITTWVAPPAANPLDPMASHKTLAYWGRLRTLRQAASVGAGEAIWLNNMSNHLAGGAVSNIFLVKDGQLLTPFARGEEVQGSLPAPVLPGTTRAAVIEIAESLDIPVHRRMLSINDLLEADEAFLTNASWLVLPIARVEKTEIGSGKVGKLTRQLRESLMKLIAEETQIDLGE